MRKIVAVFLILFLAGSVYGFNLENITETEYSPEHVNEHIEAADIPGFLSTVVGDQTLNLHLKVEEENVTVGIEMNGIRVEDTKQGGYENATVEAWVDQEDIEQLNKADKPLQQLNSRLKQDEIRYRSRGVVNKLKFSAANAALDIASAFGI